MSAAFRYVHTNLIAWDWRRLVRFYVAVFDCRPIGPERNEAGDWLTAATGVADAHLRGQHLLLPGHGESGPTLEIYSYQDTADRPQPVANHAGYGHLAFHVDEVPTVLDAVVAHDGQRSAKSPKPPCRASVSCRSRMPAIRRATSSNCNAGDRSHSAARAPTEPSA